MSEGSGLGEDNFGETCLGSKTHDLEQNGGRDSVISSRADLAVRPQNYGSLVQEKSPPSHRITSCFVVWLTFLAACGSFLFGYDTGIVSGAMLYLREEFELTDIQQEAVISVTIAAAAVFSLIGGMLNHTIGRKRTIIIASIAFTIGALVLGFALNLAMLIIGRLVVGIGIGLSSTTVPVYVAECSPPWNRGRLVTVHQFMITIGMFSANVFAGAFSYIPNGWRYMLGLAGVPSAFQLIGFLFMPESPRWLVSAGRLKDAEFVLKKIRGYEKFLRSSQPLKNTCILGRMFRSKTVRRALFIGCGLQMFQQIAGINTVMYYTATIMKMAGVWENSLAIWLSCVVSGFNVLFTIVALFLIDRVGRKPLVVVSFIGVLVSLIVLATGFQLAAVHSPAVTKETSSQECLKYSDCDQCNASPNCGFCFNDQNGTFTNGSCLVTAGAYKENSVAGPCSAEQQTTLSSIWAYDFCPSNYAWITFLGMIMYIVSFAPGLAPVPWTMNSEIYPLWARSAGNALATATNWTFNLVIAMTFLTLTTTLTKYGTYWLYSGLAVVGILFVIWFVPETKGRSLEEMEKVLSQPWLVCPW
ncbi:proton myo-inositol cotransporter-like [Liolophura sinensis]|uniref:proton myo-inositol cotransporter-like n=1 Tax=Liolophura sinensis TaxID=3198878 RepID=UPI003158EA75